MTPAWSDLYSEEELRVARAGGYFAPVGMGHRPVVLVIDVTYDFTGDQGDTHFESIAKFRLSCGPAAWTAIPHIQRLLAGARAAGIPVVYCRPNKRLQTVRRPKNSRSIDDTPESRRRGNEFPEEIAPAPGEEVIEKPRPSAFFQTPLLSLLRQLGADHLIVAGISTSGCVRATVFDGFSHDFGITVVEECVFDRFPTSHKANLFDMDSKLADVLPLAEVLSNMDNADPEASAVAVGNAVADES